MNPSPLQIVVEATGQSFGVSEHRILSGQRTQTVALARQTAMAILRDQFHISLEEIALMFDRNHATVIHACRVVESIVKTKDKTYLPMIEKALRSTAHNRRIILQ